ncbi:NAD-dependent epimerase/dehydratase family protein [Arenibaculum pallidiluteum]|uniref:NAD-dependent epimerase/dehydratase family protein n=1 Tax=Arenibaculum pallidiluteum TaxID=2812559 RepID=UPI001A962AB3|nr:NAD-dependent epimerase/dehydratase family protein [Arenibaculum pallidiluteum]
MRVLVTGATGFVGRATLAALARRGHVVRAALRRPPDGGTPAMAHEAAVVGDIGPQTDWSAALAGVDAVIHLAARVHRMREDDTDPLAAYRHVNAAGTVALARTAAAVGVRRLVLASSVKSVADGPLAAPLTDAAVPAPTSPYGISKLEAERGLFDVASASALEAVVLRPPLVYGPGVGANFLRLLATVRRGMPLPLGAVANRRSLVHVENLADALALAAEHPRAPGHAFLVQDGPALSTPDLVQALAQAMGRPARLVPVPPALIRAGARLLGRGDAADRLLGSYEVDDSGIRTILGWQPPVAAKDGLRATAEWFMTARSGQPERPS